MVKLFGQKIKYRKGCSSIMKNKIYVNTKKEMFPVAEDLYGLFFEDINRAGDGGLYPEMIRNRSFEDSLVPAGCTTDEKQLIYINRGGWSGGFNHGEGMDDWAAAVPFTSIPGWYSENAVINLDKSDTLNDNRECSMKVEFEAGGKIWNIGYSGVPVKSGAEYNLYLFYKANQVCNLTVSLESEQGVVHGSDTKEILPDGSWQRLDYKLKANADDFKGRVVFKVDEPCEINFGFTSLMPEDTYMGHGLRKDLVEMLKNLHPKFMRFPGGCVVEGLSKETAMRFSDTIGPVWQRPSHQLMWHYRTTNGLGFHEYLQLCEDLNMEPMYVCNCGMSCQARNGEVFNMEETNNLVQDALNALEYALGAVDTEFGAMRAAAGHPEPFAMKYVEIGNENFGPEYNKRYEIFYKALKEAYPDIIYISNSHTEQENLPTEYVDEHYYNGPEYFLENDTKFDDYDREGPKIFIGEYAVNGGNTIASMECALAEAVFLTGIEKNQDIVKLSAYAPLFQNADYTTWKPNLIVFDNHQVYGIPSYHAIAMMAEYRGKTVIETSADVERRPPVYKGVPAVMCEKPGMQMKNARINGKAVDISRTVYGSFVKEDDIYTMKRGGNKHSFVGKSDTWNRAFEKFIRGHRWPGQSDERDFMWVTFGDEDMEEYTFEIDLKFEQDNIVTLSSWNFHPKTDAGCNEPKDPDWNLRSVRNQIWKIEDGKGVIDRKHFFEFNKPEPEKTPLDIDYTKFNTYKIVANHFGYECYINDVLVQKKEHLLHPLIYQVASIEDENIYIKLINVGNEDIEVEVNLDCDIDSIVDVKTLSAELDEVNSMNHKLKVSPKESQITKGAKTFTFKAAKYSINVLNAKIVL